MPATKNAPATLEALFPDKSKRVKISAEEMLCDQVISFFEKGYQFKKDWSKTYTSGDIRNIATGKD